MLSLLLHKRPNVWALTTKGAGQLFSCGKVIPHHSSVQQKSGWGRGFWQDPVQEKWLNLKKNMTIKRMDKGGKQVTEERGEVVKGEEHKVKSRKPKPLHKKRKNRRRRHRKKTHLAYESKIRKRNGAATLAYLWTNMPLFWESHRKLETKMLTGKQNRSSLTPLCTCRCCKFVQSVYFVRA